MGQQGGVAFVRFEVHLSEGQSPPLSLEGAAGVVRAESVIQQLGVHPEFVVRSDLVLPGDTVTPFSVRSSWFPKKPIPVGHAHIYVVPRLVYDHIQFHGLMFDFDPLRPDAPSRQGAIIAHAGRARPEVFRSLLHEIGHLLNLAHPQHPDPYLMTPSDEVPGAPLLEFSAEDRQRATQLEAEGRLRPGTPGFTTHHAH